MSEGKNAPAEKPVDKPKTVRVQMLRTGSPGGGAIRFAGREYEVDAKLADAMIAAKDAKKV